MESDKIKKLRPGSEIEIIEETEFYLKVRHEDIEGWIHKNRLK